MRSKALLSAVLAAGLGAVAGVAFVDGPAEAGGITVPDLEVALKKAGPFVGEDQYAPTTQTVNRHLEAGQKKGVFVRIENDGDDGKIIVTGPGSNLERKIKYFLGPTNVTQKVINDGLKLKLEADKGKLMRIRLKDRNNASGDDKFFVNAEDKATGTYQDAVGVYVDRPPFS